MAIPKRYSVNMRRARKSWATNSVRTVDADTIVQLKVWLDGVSPMTWRRVQMPSSITLRELHGVIQVAWAERVFISSDFCCALGSMDHRNWELRRPR